MTRLRFETSLSPEEVVQRLMKASLPRTGGEIKYVFDRRCTRNGFHSTLYRTWFNVGTLPKQVMGARVRGRMVLSASIKPRDGGSIVHARVGLNLTSRIVSWIWFGWVLLVGMGGGVSGLMAGEHIAPAFLILTPIMLGSGILIVHTVLTVLEPDRQLLVRYVQDALAPEVSTGAASAATDR